MRDHRLSCAINTKQKRSVSSGPIDHGRLEGAQNYEFIGKTEASCTGSEKDHPDNPVNLRIKQVSSRIKVTSAEVAAEQMITEGTLSGMEVAITSTEQTSQVMTDSAPQLRITTKRSPSAAPSSINDGANLVTCRQQLSSTVATQNGVVAEHHDSRWLDQP